MRLILIFCALLWSAAATASEFRILGQAKMFSNDYLGDGMDRWRSGSYTRSTIFGRGWDGDLAGRQIFELRLRGELIAPTDTSQAPQPGERPFVGTISIGGAQHLRFRDLDVRAGIDAVIVGPQSGVSRFVEVAHDILGFEEPLAASGEIANDIFPTANLEASRLVIPQGVGFQLRPFVEAQAGAETYVRFGVDAFFGQGIAGDLVTRDVVTGNVMTAVSMQEMVGFAPTVGVDVTRVYGSSYLPSSSGLAPKDWRMRVRGGMRNRGQDRDLFIGFTWLSPEYDGQPEGQVLGSLTIDHRF